jgi:hypothetical protein
MGRQLQTDRRTADKSTLPKAGVQCFYDSSEVNQTVVLRMQFRAKTSRLRQSVNR